MEIEKEKEKELEPIHFLNTLVHSIWNSLKIWKFFKEGLKQGSEPKDPFVETREIFFPNGTIAYQNVRFYKVKSYVGLLAPKHLGGKVLEHQICYESIRVPGIFTLKKLEPLKTYETKHFIFQAS